MSGTLYQFHWLGTRIFSIWVLLARRSWILKGLFLLLLFVVFECMYKIKFSFVDITYNTVNRRMLRIGLHSIYEKTDQEGLYYNNTSSTGMDNGSFGIYTPKREMAVAYTNMTSQVRIKSARNKSDDLILRLRSVNASFLVEDILIGSTPFPSTNPHTYNLISIPAGCGFQGDRPAILLLVQSKAEYRLQRKIIRKKVTRYKDTNIHLVFLLGYEEDVQYVIDEESDAYRDILQEDFRESNNNNTLKMIMGYNWAVKSCPKVDIIFNLRDNIQIKSELVFEYIRDIVIDYPTNFYRGKVISNIPSSDPDIEALRGYISGNAYIISPDVAFKFQTVFPFVKQYDDPDVYLGLVADILQVTLSHDSYFDLEYPTSYFSASTKVNSKDLLSYPLAINMNRLVRLKLGYGEGIPFSPVNVQSMSFIHNASQCDFAQGDSTMKNILVVIYSDAADYEQRTSLRDLWRSFNIESTRQIFVLGADDANQTIVAEEGRGYHDLIQIKTSAGRFNNTIRMVYTYQWIVKYCQKASYIVFLDGNVHVDNKAFISYIEYLTKNNFRNLFAGSLSESRSPNRSKDSLMFLSEEDYPFNQLPPYLLGPNYVISFETARSFDAAFPYVKYFPVVDIYLGIVASKLLVKPTYDPHFDWTSAQSFITDVPSVAIERLTPG